MIRKLNRIVQDFLRPKRLALGKYIWDKKNIKDNRVMDGKLDMKRIKSILFLRYDGKIGDMVISTILFREIKRVYPNIKVAVVSRGGALDIVKADNNVDKTYAYEKGNENDLAKEISKENYDVLVDFNEMLRVNQMKFINRCGAKINIGLGKQDWNMFDISYSKNIDEHISCMYKNILNILEIENPNVEPAFKIDENIKIKDKIKEKLVLLNPYAASKHRSLNEENILKIGKLVLDKGDTKLVLIGEPSKIDELKKYADILGKDSVIIPETKNILDVAAWVDRSDFIISPDTSIVHIASAFRKPMIAIYRLDTGDNNSKVWAPNYKDAKQIFSKDVAKVGEESDINKFDMDDITRELN